MTIDTKIYRSFVLPLLLAALIPGCQTPDNGKPVQTVSPTANTSAVTPATELTGYSLASPSDAYRTAYDARKKCDMQALKRVMSKALTDAMTQRGESDPDARKTLDEMLKQLCDLPEAPNGAIKDEKIVGDEGTVKYQDETGEWRLMDFVRENGEWKLTLPRGNSELPALK
jgi:hypothetical protein